LFFSVMIQYTNRLHPLQGAALVLAGTGKK
jgi:hypothetical protein